MAQLVDIKSRDTTPITVNLRMREYGATPSLAGRVMQRSVLVKDKVSGEVRSQSVEVKCPPAVRWPAGGTVKGLPISVLDHPAIKSMLARHPGRRPLLQVVKQYEDPATEAAKAKTKSGKSKKSTPNLFSK